MEKLVQKLLALLAEGKVLVLFRHGDKTKKDNTPGGELTTLGRKQVWSTSWQLVEKFGQETMRLAVLFSSPVHRVQESALIFQGAIGGMIPEPDLFNRLEWGPNSGHNNDEFALELVSSSLANTKIVVAFGHNGLWENIAQAVFPRDGRYSIQPGEAFVITSEGIEVIRPQV